MADIFLSYASEDREAAVAIANVLEGRSWTVWWDRKIPAGEAFDEVIEREIASAKVVVVLWSTRSTRSEWVKNEAASAVDADKLVPVQIDDCKLPLEFRRRQTLNLAGWTGDAADSRLQGLFEAVSSRSVRQAPITGSTGSAATPESTRSWKAALVVAAILASGLGAFLFYQARTSVPTSAAAEASRELLGTWTHSSSVFWVISKGEGSSFSVRQTDPDKGLTMRGTALRSGDGYDLKFEVLPAPVVTGKATLTIVDNGNTLRVDYAYDKGDSGRLLFHR